MIEHVALLRFALWVDEYVVDIPKGNEIVLDIGISPNVHPMTYWSYSKLHSEVARVLRETSPEGSLCKADTSDHYVVSFYYGIYVTYLSTAAEISSPLLTQTLEVLLGSENKISKSSKRVLQGLAKALRKIRERSDVAHLPAVLKRRSH
jgi:hypothetical protein